jgi:coenzyme F420-reducing hydrogenase delta subunit
MRDSKDMTIEELKDEIKALGASKERMEKAVVSMAEGRRLKRIRLQDRARRLEKEIASLSYAESSKRS